MTNNSKLDEVSTYMLEDWVRIFGDIYRNADADRNASSLWLEVIEESSTIAEYIRREEYKKAIDKIPDVFCRLLCFVAKYSINAADVQNEGIDLRPDNNCNIYLTEWVLRKYPDVCSICAQNPCICPSLRYERETRNENLKIAENMSIRIQTHHAWENNIKDKIYSYNVENLFNMFNGIYRGVHYDPTISSLCFHFLEEVGDVANLLLSFNNIQALGGEGKGNHKNYLESLNNDLRNEISDVISWIMSLIDKVNCIFRSTYPHHYCFLSEEKIPDRICKDITLSELTLNRYFETQSQRFICPYCKSDMCSPDCKQNRLINDTEIRMKLFHEFKKTMGMEKRRDLRECNDILGMIDNMEARIQDMGETSIGFLYNDILPLDDVKTVTIKQNDIEENILFKITRPTDANPNTGFVYFYGAEILDRKKQTGHNEV
jgi:NTP pyrophosphatase (non-canonical NTP hydrolase)